MFRPINLRRQLLVWFILISISCLSQSKGVKPFGEISLEEMMMNTCSFDSAAVAMILFDKGDFELDMGRGTTYKRHVRIKILKKEGADVWASNIVFYGKGELSFSKFKGSTYNLVDGKIIETKVGDEGLFKGKYDKHTNQARFSLPQVKEGSIIEYTFTLSSGDLQSPPSWQFQYEIPVLWSEYVTYIPNKYLTFRKDWQGFLQPQSQQEGNNEKLTMANVPAFKEESFTTSSENYVSQLNLYLEKIWVPGFPVQNFIKSWGTVAGSLNQSELGIQVKGSGYLMNIVAEHTAGITDPEKKVEVLYDFVKKSITWNEVTDVTPDREFKEVLEKKSGSSSEINGILIALLKKADLDAEPVLIRTRDRGFIKPFLPVLSQFNDVICRVKINEKVMLLDATLNEMPMTMLPKRCINGQGMVVTNEIYEWIDITTSRSRIATSTELVLADDGSASGKLTISHDGAYASTMRKSYKKQGEAEYVKTFLLGKNWELTKSSFENIQDYKGAAKETHNITITDFGQSIGSTIYFNPIAHGRFEANPFKTEKREYPVDYGNTFDEVYLGKIRIPEGFAIEELPKPIVYTLPENAGKFTYSVTTKDNVITVVNQFIINKSIFDIEQYPRLREFYTQVLAKQSEQIVLKKRQ